MIEKSKEGLKLAKARMSPTEATAASSTSTCGVDSKPLDIKNFSTVSIIFPPSSHLTHYLLSCASSNLAPLRILRLFHCASLEDQVEVVMLVISQHTHTHVISMASSHGLHEATAFDCRVSGQGLMV